MPNALPLLRAHRRQLRVALTIALAVFTATTLYTYTRPRIYEATAKVILYDRTSVPTGTTIHTKIWSGEDTNTAIKVIESATLIKRVADHLTAEEWDQITNQSKGAQTALDALAAKRTVSRHEQDFTISISYRDKSPALAARIATLLATEFKSWSERITISENMITVEDLGIRIKVLTTRVAQLEEALAQSDPTSATYADQKKDLELNKEFLVQLVERVAYIEKSRSDLEQARINSLPRVLPAEVPALKDYVEPNHPLHLGLGLLAGLLLGGIAAVVSNPTRPLRIRHLTAPWGRRSPITAAASHLPNRKPGMTEEN